MATALETRQHERDRAEQELRDSEDRYRLLFEQNPHPMWVFDPETLAFLEVNDAAVRHYGYSRVEFLSMRITDIRPPEDVPRLAGVLDAVRPQLFKAGMWRHCLKSGQVIDVDVTSHTLAVKGMTAVLVTAQDVTARTIAERGLAERACLAALTADVGAALNKPDVLKPCLQSCADALVEHLAAAARVWTVSASGSCLELQASAGFRTDLDDVHDRILIGERTAGRIAETRSPHHSNSLESDAAVDERDWASRKGITSFAGYPLVVDERVVGVLAVFAHERLSETMTGALASVANHIALGIKRHHTEEARRLLAYLVEAAEERTRFALEASRVGVWEADLKTGVCNWSPVLESLHGLPVGSFGGTFDAFIECIDAAERQAARAAIAQATRDRHDAQVVYRTIWPDGSEHWISTVGRVFYDKDGAPIRAAGVAMDVTDRRVLEDQLRQSQKMEAIGQLAGGIAHDFNNLLTAIQGYAEFLTETLPEGNPSRADVDEITSAAKRAAALTRQLLAFSRKQILAPRVVQVGNVVAGLTPMLRRLIGETVDLKTVTSEKGHVKADAGQLEQILVNLSVNARDAMPNGGRLTIETEDVWLDHAYARLHPSVTAGPHVLIAVSDTGHGMDAQTKARIFEPFFTTKPKGQGTGLGLAMVYGVVKQSTGHVWVYSEVNRGTTFKVYLPTTEEPVAREPVAATAPPETILLVEDEDVVRDFASKVLGRHGYAVHAVAEPSRALEFALAHRGVIDVLLSDVVLPEMNGRALAGRVEELHPEVKILFMSGYTDNAIVHHGVLDEGMWFLQKPFSAQALVERVRDLLEATAAAKR
jgi:PAS domain S-box-containing protein